MIWIGILCLIVAGLAWINHKITDVRLRELGIKLDEIERDIKNRINALSDNDLVELANERRSRRLAGENPPDQAG